jgi:hypothetical protein
MVDARSMFGSKGKTSAMRRRAVGVAEAEGVVFVLF